MLAQLIESLAARGIAAQIEKDHYFAAHSQAVVLGHFTIREARGQLYVSFIGLGNMPFSSVDDAADFLAQNAHAEAPEYVS